MRNELSILVIAVGLCAAVKGQEWVRFRGPNGGGVSLAKTVPAVWTEHDYNWKVRLPGRGHSSPVIWGEHVFITSSDEKGGELYVLCLNAGDGSVRWKRAFKFLPFSKHPYNDYAASTPAVDEKRLYFCWSVPARYTLMAIDHEGNTVWERDLGPCVSQHGSGTSPVLHDGKVILANEQDGESFLVAVESGTGRTVWKTARRQDRATYSTPCVYQAGGEKPLLIFNSQPHGISAVDAADGRPVWEFSAAFDKRSVSSPVVASGLILGSCGSGGGGNYLVAIRPGDSSGARKPELVYQIRRGAPYVPTSVALGEYAYLFSDAGIGSCLHVPSGEIKWQERVGSGFFSSPIAVDNRIYAVATSGEVIVLAASPVFKLLAKNPLGELTRATPAVSEGRLYLRTIEHLISVGGKTAAGQ